MVKNLVTTMIQSNAEMAAEQERNLAASKTNFEMSVGDLNQRILETGASLGQFQSVMVRFRTQLWSAYTYAL